MVKIRLSRIGRKNLPFYRIVVTPAREKRESNVIEYVGTYAPATKTVELKDDRIKYWLSVGAQPTETVHSMLAKKGLMEAPKKRVFKKTAGKKTTERKKA